MVHHSDGPAGPANDWATSFEPRETDLLIADIDFDEAEIVSAVVSAPTRSSRSRACVVGARASGDQGESEKLRQDADLCVLASASLG